MLRPSRTDLFGSDGTPRVAIVGAGFGGIGLAVLLKKAGVDTFTVYEKADGPGGTWWHNRYPGAEVDSASVVYSYSFRPHGWTRTHARQAELLRYLNDTVDEFGVRPHLRCGVGVESARWDEANHLYHLTLSTGETTDCHVLVSATGFLNIPNYPKLPGLADFQGPAFHTARWEHEHDLTGRTVAVVGTGSTATQVVPELATIVSKLYLFQREPGWVVPKGERDHTPQEQARLAKRWRYRIARLRWFYDTEKRLWRGQSFRPGTLQNAAGERVSLRYIDREFADRPDLKKLVTPTYPWWGKRLVMNSTFYPALKRDNVELVPRAVRAVTRTGVVDEDGTERAVDALVLATGFQTTDYVGTMEVRGRGGQTLREYWQGEPRAFLGITVPTFPNFYMLYGPGTNGGEIVSVLMRAAEHVVRDVRRMRRRRVSALEVRPTWAGMFHGWLLAKVDLTVWGLANNYYRAASGKIVTQWPFSPGLYGVLVRTLGRASETTRRRDDPGAPNRRSTESED